MQRNQVMASLFGVALSAAGGAQAADVVVSGTITGNQTWTANNTYILTGAVFIDGATVTIEPGTTILGDSATNGTLVVARGG
ncbi:MAG TPA: hypothetical protein VGB99_08420, partial [Acidobacteriota bacterium]